MGITLVLVIIIVVYIIIFLSDGLVEYKLEGVDEDIAIMLQR